MLYLRYRHGLNSMLLLVALAMGNGSMEAQSFTDHVRQPGGKASVVITQSQDVEKLVNSRPALTEKQMRAEQNAANSQQTAREKEAAKEREAARELVAGSAQHQQQHPAGSQPTSTREPNNSDLDIPVVDMRKKVMRNGYKVQGYRVQAFAGRNSKADRIKAENIGSAIKMKFPDQPVYVHFYSPRWICRVGNYRSYDEAQRMLKQIKAMGYASATIVKGQITVKDK